MLFTPDERRALITVAGLLTLGLAVRLIAPGPPPPKGGGDSLLVVIAEGTEMGEIAPPAPPPGLLEEGKLRINEATSSELTALPRIGPVLADRIVLDRQENGPFRSSADLVRVRGIGSKTAQRLDQLVSYFLAPSISPADCTETMRYARQEIRQD